MQNCTILCAADLWGTKVNYELIFPNLPSSLELQQKVEDVFAPEHAARRPADIPPTQSFDIDRMQTFDEKAQQWVDLLTPAQLQDFSQVYVFQKENEFHREVQSKIPPPVPAPITRALALSGTTPSKVTSPEPAASNFAAPASTFPPQQPAPLPQQPASATPSAPASASGLVSTPAATAPVTSFGATAASNIPEGRTIPFHEKQRFVFDEMDCKRSRLLEHDDFRSIFSRLRLDYPIVSPTDLFVKADANKDNVISYEEWRMFSELYPTLLDSLYFRAKDFQTDANQQQAIDSSKERLTDLREKERDARMSSMQAQADTAGQEQKLAIQIAAAQESQTREREAKAVLEAAHEDTERGREELRSRIVEQNQQKEKERQKQVEVMEAVRNVENVQRKLAVQEAEQTKAEELLLEMEKRVQEQRRVLERCQASVDKVRGELASVQGAEHLANIVLGEAQKDTQVCNERVSLAETEVASRQEREREATACHRESQNDAARQLAKRDMEERELQALKEKEAARVIMEEDAVKLVEEQENVTQALERENMELNVQRRQVEEEERPLLEQELKLREMRDALEENEARLRNDHRTFHSAHGRGGTAADTTSSPARASPARGASRSPFLGATAPAPASVAGAASPAQSAGRPLPSIQQVVPPLPSYLPQYEAAPALSLIPPPRGMSPNGRV